MINTSVRLNKISNTPFCSNTIRLLNLIGICFIIFFFGASAFAAQPKLTFYLPFNGSAKPAVADGSLKVHFGNAGKPRFTTGLNGQGYLTGQEGQQLRFAGKGNINPTQWTISFWMKGLKGASWYGKSGFQQFWGLDGTNREILWFYHYNNRPAPWIFYRPKGAKQTIRWTYVPKVDIQKWNCWVLTWRKGSSAYLYLNGQLVGQTKAVSPQPVRWIMVGGSHLKKPDNKIIDEFKIYNTALTPQQIACKYYQEGRKITAPILTVAPGNHPITIDGNITSGEWKSAAGFAGLINTTKWTTAKTMTQGRIAYNNKYLYLALHSDIPKKVIAHPDQLALHGLVKKTAVKHDGNVAGDDHFAIILQPESSNKRYAIDINALGIAADFTQSNTEKSDLKWNSHIKVKSTVNMQGWSMEAAIPLKALGINHIKPGSTWKMNFSRVWKMLQQTTDKWSAGRYPKLGEVHFVTAQHPIASLQKFNVSSTGKVQTNLTLIARNSGASDLTVTLTAGTQTITKKTVALKSGQQQTLSLDAQAKDAGGKLITITVTSGSTIILRQSAPLIPKQVGQLALWKYPSQGRIRVGWTIQTSKKPEQITVEAALKNSQGKTVLTGKKEHLSSANGSLLMDIKPISDGKYTLTVQIVSGNDVLQKKIFAYTKKPLPKWLGNKLGISKTPPVPWTNVKVNKANDTISIWGRQYQYDHHLLPTQIINQGKAMLAGPMQLLLDSRFRGNDEGRGNGEKGQTIDSARAHTTVHWEKTTSRRAVSNRTQNLGAVQAKIHSYTTFDGMTWMELTVEPTSGSARINNLTLQIPLKNTWAKLIKPYFDYRLKNTGYLTTKKWQGKAMKTMPWIGNGDGGIQIFQQDVLNWIGSKTITISKAGATAGARVIRIHLIDKPTRLTKPLHIALGWIVSPVKKPRSDMRNFRFLQGGSLQPGDKTVSGNYLVNASKLNPKLKAFIPWMTGWWWMPEHNGRVRNPATFPIPSADAKFVRYYQGIPLYFAPYGRLTQIATDNSAFKQFGDQWTASTSKFHPNITAPPAQRIANVSVTSRSLRDFFAWGYHQVFDQHHARAAYFDVSRPKFDTNIYHGMGVVQSDGSIKPQMNILATRKAFERIYTELKAKYPDGIIFYHTSGEILLPIDSFCDVIIDGENYTGLLNRKNNRGYENVLSLTQFRTEYSAQNNYGPATVFLPEFSRSGAIMPDEWKALGYQHAQYLLGLVLLHDSSIWWTYFPDKVLANAYSALDKTGWDASWKFIAYWHQKVFNNLPKGVVASLYVAPDKSKAIAVIMNVSNKDQTIKLNHNKYKNRSTIYPSHSATSNGSAITSLNIEKDNFKIVLLTR